MTNLTMLLYRGLLVVVCAVAFSFQVSGNPIVLRPGPHLFIDDFLIEQSNNLTRTTHQPQRWLQLFPKPDEPWHERVLPYMKVIRYPEEGLFRMWYNIMNPSEGGPYRAFGYAESKDGIHWVRPNLGLVDVDGSKENNLYWTSSWGNGLSVDDGPDCPDAARRYKLAYVYGGMGVAFSADGLHWEDYPENPVLPHYPYDHPEARKAVGDIITASYDPIRQRYVAFVKMYSFPEDGYKGTTPHMVDEHRRLVGQSVSEDFIHWAQPWRIMVPDDRDEGITEFYGMVMTVRGDLCIGFVRILRDDLPADPDGPVQGIGYTQLATSRDGEHWERHRDVFLDRNHTPGTWDHAVAWMGCCVEVGEEVYLYYGGYSAGHKAGDRQIGMARLRKDGYVSRDAGSGEGKLRTPLVKINGSRMTVNADAKDGEVRVAVLDAAGRPLRGFTWADCLPIVRDSTACPVRWKRPLSRLRDKPVHLEFSLQQAHLFGFEIKQ